MLLIILGIKWNEGQIGEAMLLIGLHEYLGCLVYSLESNLDHLGHFGSSLMWMLFYGREECFQSLTSGRD